MNAVASLPKGSTGFEGMNCLWCIDTDEHDACGLASVSDLDGVAVNDSGYWVGGVSEEKSQWDRTSGMSL